MTPPPRIMWTILNLGKKWYLMTPPLGPNLGKNWNVDYFEIFVPPLILAKTGPKLFDRCKNSTKSYLTVTMGLFPSNNSHICTKFCLYLTFISPMNYQIPDHISVIWIWEKFENPDPPPSSQSSLHFELWTFWFSALTPFGLFPQFWNSNLDGSPKIGSDKKYLLPIQARKNRMSWARCLFSPYTGTFLYMISKKFYDYWLIINI